MIILLIILFVILYGMSIKPFSHFKDYCSMEKTTCIKGIFVMFVFIRHVQSYITFDGIFNKPIIIVDSLLNQCIVALFLFYSGYGIYEKIKGKDSDKYISAIPNNRIFNLLKRFWLALATFLLVDILIGKISDYTIVDILLSLFGMRSIGNSNWFIFLMLILYSITFISFKIFSNRKNWSEICIILLLSLYVIVISFFKDPWWWNTAFCYVGGMFYSKHKAFFESKLQNNKIYYFVFLIMLLLFLLLNYIYFTLKFEFIYIVISLLFSALIVIMSMKISISNKALYFLGKNTFWIYILQRIPMIVLCRLGLSNAYIFTFLCFLITILMTIVYNSISKKYLDRRVI